MNNIFQDVVQLPPHCDSHNVELQKQRVSARFTTYAIIFFLGLCCGLETDLYLKLWWCLFCLWVSLCYCCPFWAPWSTLWEAVTEKHCFLIPNPIILIQWLENLERRERKRKRRAKKRRGKHEGKETSKGKRRRRRRRVGTPPSSFLLFFKKMFINSLIYLFICLCQVLVAAHWDLVPWPKLSPGLLYREYDGVLAHWILGYSHSIKLFSSVNHPQCQWSKLWMALESRVLGTCQPCEEHLRMWTSSMTMGTLRNNSNTWLGLNCERYPGISLPYAWCL